MKVITYFYRVFFYFFLLNIDEVVSRIITQECESRSSFNRTILENCLVLANDFLENKPVIALQFLFSRFVRVLMTRE